MSANDEGEPVVTRELAIEVDILLGRLNDELRNVEQGKSERDSGTARIVGSEQTVQVLRETLKDKTKHLSDHQKYVMLKVPRDL